LADISYNYINMNCLRMNQSYKHKKHRKLIMRSRKMCKYKQIWGGDLF